MNLWVIKKKKEVVDYKWKCHSSNSSKRGKQHQCMFVTTYVKEGHRVCVYCVDHSF